MTESDKAAMQQALDALLGYKPYSLTHAKEQGSAIIALRNALAEPVHPQRVPLTDSQIIDAASQLDAEWFITFTRAIEAAHGIGSEGGA